MKDLGVLVPIVTPCTPAGVPDSTGLQSVTRFMLAAGCHAFFVAGSTGRGPWFSRSDRATICRTVAGQIGPRVPLFAGCSAPGLPDMLENTRAMADAGARFAVVTAPGYFVYSQREVETIFLKFADASPLPVMIYDIPAFAGMKLDLGMVRRLAGHPNVIGFKDSSADMDRFQSLLASLADRPDFFLLQGKEHLIEGSLVAGASGLVVSLLHVDPRPFVGVHAACRAGDREKAGKYQACITNVYHVMVKCFDRRPETSTLFHLLNYVLRKKGIAENIVLAHEGPCPAWVAEEAVKALDYCEAVA